MIDVGRKASAGAATVDEGRLTAFPLMGGLKAGPSDVVGEDTSEAVPLSSAGRGGLTRLGFVMGIADFATVREAIALVRARWCGERADRIICKLMRTKVIKELGCTYFALQQLLLPMR